MTAGRGGGSGRAAPAAGRAGTGAGRLRRGVRAGARSAWDRPRAWGTEPEGRPGRTEREKEMNSSGNILYELKIVRFLTPLFWGPM